MFLLVSVRHVGAHPDEFQHGVSIQSSINLGKTFPRISRIRVIPSTQILARVFVYLPPFISQILDLICRMVLIFILIYFGWRDIENQQYCDIFRRLRMEQYLKNTFDRAVHFRIGRLGIVFWIVLWILNWIAAPNYLRHSGANNPERTASL